MLEAERCDDVKFMVADVRESKPIFTLFHVKPARIASLR